MAYRSREAGADVRLLAIPDSTPEALDPFAFVPEEMQTFYATGFRLGADPAAWRRFEDITEAPPVPPYRATHRPCPQIAREACASP